MRRSLWAVVLVLSLWPAGCDEEKPTPETPVAATVAPEPAVVSSPEPTSPAIIPSGEATAPDSGIAARPLALDPARPLPDGIAVIAVTGCWQCDGPPSGLIRVYRDQSGVTRADTLFQRTEGSTRESYISGVAMAPDASDMAISICERGYCGALNAVTSDAHTVVLRSRDGGVSWSEIAALDGAYGVVAIVRDGVIVSGPYLPRDTAVSAPTYWRYPGRQPILPPTSSGGGWPLALPGGELGWYSNDRQRLLTDDGHVALDLTHLNLGIGGAEVTPAPDGGRFAASWWSSPPGQPPSAGRYLLGVLDADGRVSSGFTTVGGGRAGVWLDHRRVLGNVTVTGGSPGLVVSGYVPAVIDLESGRAEPVSEGFGRGRNRIEAVMRGPFARVRGTGDCLLIRAQPSRDAVARDCAADGVLLRDLGELRRADQSWLKVATPSGSEGWASEAYLER